MDKKKSYKTLRAHIADSKGWKVITTVFLWGCGLINSSGGSMVIALVTIGAAAIVSVASTDIMSDWRKVHTLADIRATEYLWPAIKFSLAAVGLVFLREVGVVASAKKKDKELSDRLTTMPPKQFLAAYSEAVINIRILYEDQQAYTEPLTASEIAKDIRIVLTQILVLAQNWDSSPQETYRANVMLVEQDKTKIRKHLAMQVESSPFFLFESNIDARLDRADGILHLSDLDLSTVINKQQQGEPDYEIQPICFPFKLSTQDKSIVQPNVPGAPVAITTLSPQYIRDCRAHFTKWLDEESENNPYLTQHYKDTVSKYYRAHRHATSILSIPLFTVDERSEETTLLGCLNIYNNKADMLMGESRNDQFVQLLQPICAYLFDMISLYRIFLDAEADDHE